MKRAILVIDVQEYFMNEHTRHLPGRIASFLRTHEFDHVLFVKFVNGKDSNWVKLLGWRKLFDPKDAKIASDLQAFVADDNVFIKRVSFSAFRVKKFVEYLSACNIKDLYVCGLDTDACVYSTTMEAFERGYNVRLVSDLCADHHGKRHHQMALELLERNLSKNVVLSSEEVEDKIK